MGEGREGGREVLSCKRVGWSVFSLPRKSGQFDAKYVLLFYYYGGMVYACLHQYLKALLFLTVVCCTLTCGASDNLPFSFPQCLTTPTIAISAIMVAAYKKFVLVSLLKFGKVSECVSACAQFWTKVLSLQVIVLPRYCSHIVERMIKVS